MSKLKDVDGGIVINKEMAKTSIPYLYEDRLKRINNLLHQPITENEVVKTKVINNTLVINVRPK